MPLELQTSVPGVLWDVLGVLQYHICTKNDGFASGEPRRPNKSDDGCENGGGA